MSNVFPDWPPTALHASSGAGGNPGVGGTPLPAGTTPAGSGMPPPWQMFVPQVGGQGRTAFTSHDPTGAAQQATAPGGPATQRLAALLQKIDHALQLQQGLASAPAADTLRQAIHTLAEDPLVHLLDLDITDAAENICQAWRDGEPVHPLLPLLYDTCNAQLPPDLKVNRTTSAPQGMAPAAGGAGASTQAEPDWLRASTVDERTHLVISELKANAHMSTAALQQVLNARAGLHTWKTLRYQSVQSLRNEVLAMYKASEGARGSSIAAEVYSMLRVNPNVSVDEVSARLVKKGFTDTSDERIIQLLNLAQMGIDDQLLNGTSRAAGAVTASTRLPAAARDAAILRTVARCGALTPGQLTYRVALALNYPNPRHTGSLDKNVRLASDICADAARPAGQATSAIGALYILLREHEEFHSDKPETRVALFNAWSDGRSDVERRQFSRYRHLCLLALDHGVFSQTTRTPATANANPYPP